jgi:hypothetical protein
MEKNLQQQNIDPNNSNNNDMNDDGWENENVHVLV